MTASQIASALHARRIAKGKWMAKCAAHDDRGPSLSITDMGNGRTRLHCFSGCEQSAVLEAAGLRWADLRPGEPDPYWKAQMRDREALERQEHRHGLAIMMQSVEPSHRVYWATVERNIAAEIAGLSNIMFPNETAQQRHAETTQHLISEYGFKELD